MKKPTHYFKITLFTVLIFGLNQSCELDDLSESEANQVSEQDAQRVAENLLFPDTDRSDTASFRLNKDDYTTQKSVSTIDAITGRSSDPLFYVVNYDNGGFAIISGDKRIEPVLAYSKHSNFPIEDKMSLPPGLVDWLEDYAAIVLEVRKENVSPSVRISSMWERILETQFNIDFLEILTCEDGSIDFG
ncbi:MAG: Spi family protease inhibitor, partial [Cryomorphaceae bacterium]|nr:Spi family protease inhibitor [Cryomorphaceae bacterium]